MIDAAEYRNRRLVTLLPAAVGGPRPLRRRVDGLRTSQINKAMSWRSGGTDGSVAENKDDFVGVAAAVSDEPE